MSRRAEIAAHQALVQRKNQLLQLQLQHHNSEDQLFADRACDPLDQATAHGEVTLIEQISEREVRELQAIRRALGRIRGGSYDRCAGCGSRISWARLEAIPWTDVCIECAGKREPVPAERAH